MEWAIFAVLLIAVVTWPVAKRMGKEEGREEALADIERTWRVRPDGIGSAASFVHSSLRAADPSPTQMQEDAVMWLNRLEQVVGETLQEPVL